MSATIYRIVELEDQAGPFFLTVSTIDNVVRLTSAGVFLLGTTHGRTFRVSRVGRSDADINAELKKSIPTYPEFEFQYCVSAYAAFEKECDLYHKLEPPDNRAHPARPEGTSWRCPGCREFG